MDTSVRERGSGWIAFAGVVLILSGLLNIVNGLWALDHDNAPINDLLYENDLTTWGWVWLIVGIIVFVAGFAVLARAQWARWVGIIVASVSVVANMLTVFAYPISSLILVFVGLLVIHALSVYGERELA
jgi:uncharacterized membrane protein HdeD (DUF308 family)